MSHCYSDDIYWNGYLNKI